MILWQFPLSHFAISLTSERVGQAGPSDVGERTQTGGRRGSFSRRCREAGDGGRESGQGGRRRGRTGLCRSLWDAGRAGVILRLTSTLRVRLSMVGVETPEVPPLSSPGV